MYRKIQDFISDWEAETASTVKIFKAIDNEVLNRKVNDDVRTPGKLAWHITLTLTEMPFHAGICGNDPLEGKNIPEDVGQIIDIYKKYSTELIDLVKKKWKDSDLDDEIEMYGQKWKKNKVLSVLVMHQVHHRAQLTVVMRLLGMKVPGIYGPAKEEWSAFGMEPQE